MHQLHRRVLGAGSAAIIGLGVVGCASGPREPAEPVAANSSSAEAGSGRNSGTSASTEQSASSSELSNGPDPAADASDEAAPGAGEIKPADLIGLICERTCQRVEKNCEAKQAKFCRASCRDYVSGAEHCPVEIHGALSCQQDAEDFQLCANISNEACVPLFRKMLDCRSGKTKPRVWGDMSADAKTNFAEGLKHLKVTGYGISQLMPEGTSVEAAATYRAIKEEGGARFVIEAVPLEGKTLSAASMLRTVTKYVGNACQPKLRLHGRFESGGATHTRFDTVCKDGTEYHGVAHFWSDRALMVAHIGPASAALEEGRRDAFLFGFRMD